MKHLHPKQNNLKVLKEWFSINKSTYGGCFHCILFHCILEQERLDSKCPVNFFFSLKARSAEAGAGAEVFCTFLILDANILQKLLFLFILSLKIKYLSGVCHRSCEVKCLNGRVRLLVFVNQYSINLTNGFYFSHYSKIGKTISFMFSCCSLNYKLRKM